MKFMSLKATVRIKRWTPAISMMFNRAELLMNRYPWVPQLVITSINDSTHSTNSRHYTDEAIDIRSKNFGDDTEKILFASLLREELGSKFTVLLEDLGKDNEHFHVQVKKGGTYP